MPKAPESGAPVATRPAIVVLAGAVYAAVGLLTLYLATNIGLAAAVWPAAGIAFALVYQRGRLVAVGVLVGSFLVNSITLATQQRSMPTVVVTAGLIAIGAALQALLGGELVTRRLGRHVSLTRVGQISAFLVLAGPVACLVNATVGVGAQVLTGVIQLHDALLAWMTWWAGDSLGVIVFAPITLMLMRDQGDVWRDRRWKVAAPSVVVTVVLLAGFVSNRDLEQDRVHQREEQIAAQAASDLAGVIGVHGEVLRGIGGFVESSDFVEATEFRSYTRSALERYPAVQALSWNPYLRKLAVPAFLAAERAQPGYEDYRITERDAAGGLVPAGDRLTYVPVAYIEPLATNAAALGFDILSSPVRAEAIRYAIANGEMTATAPIDLVQDTGTQKGMLTLFPVYAGGVVPALEQERRAQILGFAVGVYRLGDLVRDTFTGSDWSHVRVVLVDTTDPREPLEIGRHDGDLAGGAGDPHESVVDVNGRTWTVVVTVADAVVADVRTSNVPALLLAAVLVLGLLEVFLLLVTGLERQARREAETSSYDAEHDPLTDLYNRRGFRYALRAARERTLEEGQHHFLMFLDLDGFKAVNDRGGHDAGDALLQLVAAAMQRQVRRRDIVARLGGDEFAVVLNDCGVERGLAIARSILDAVAEVSVRSGDQDLSVRVSIGAVPIVGPQPPTVDELITIADRACFAAKRSGAGVVFEDVASAPTT